MIKLGNFEAYTPPAQPAPTFAAHRERLRQALREFLKVCPHDLVFEKEVKALVDQVQPYEYSQWGGQPRRKESLASPTTTPRRDFPSSYDADDDE
jgi:hypothetical protein